MANPRAQARASAAISNRVMAVELGQQSVLETCQRIEQKQDRFCAIAQTTAADVGTMKHDLSRIDETVAGHSKRFHELSNEINTMKLQAAMNSGESKGKRWLANLIVSLFGGGTGAAAVIKLLKP